MSILIGNVSCDTLRAVNAKPSRATRRNLSVRVQLMNKIESLACLIGRNQEDAAQHQAALERTTDFSLRSYLNRFINGLVARRAELIEELGNVQLQISQLD